MICPVCGGPDVAAPEEAGPAAVDGMAFGSSRRLGRGAVHAPPVAVCMSCGLGWQHPMPHAEALEAAYARLEDETYLAQAELRRRSARAMLDVLERHASPRRGRLLDVGCSAGIFLAEAGARGWVGTGVEPSRSLAAAARARTRGTILEVPFERAELADGAFDALTMWDVLEHVVDPARFIAKASRTLVTGGVLALNVPRRDSVVARVLGRRWPLLLPEHLYYFSIPSLRLLLAREFEVLGFHGHPVQFPVGYVFERLSQHGWPLATVLARLTGRWSSRLTVPLRMGEITVVARRR